jgi:polyhydroxybutyrate depolymerase
VLAVIDLVIELRRDERTLIVDGVERSFDLVTTGKAGAAPVPLVFVFHGRGGSGLEIRFRSGIAAAAAARDERALFVFPQALTLPGTRVIAWQGACDGPDMHFVDAIIRSLSAEYAVDRTRIFASGFSWGGEMAIDFGCCRHEQVRAIAPMSGAVWDNLGEQCRARAPAYRIAVGTDDPLLPLSVVQHVTDQFRVRQQCGQHSVPAEPHCQAFEGCRVPVIQCVYPGMGHQLPSNAGAEIWSFLSSFAHAAGAD